MKTMLLTLALIAINGSSLADSRYPVTGGYTMAGSDWCNPGNSKIRSTMRSLIIDGIKPTCDAVEARIVADIAHNDRFTNIEQYAIGRLYGKWNGEEFVIIQDSRDGVWKHTTQIGRTYPEAEIIKIAEGFWGHTHLSLTGVLADKISADAQKTAAREALFSMREILPTFRAAEVSYQATLDEKERLQSIFSEANSKVREYQQAGLPVPASIQAAQNVAFTALLSYKPVVAQALYIVANLELQVIHFNGIYIAYYGDWSYYDRRRPSQARYS